MRDEIRKKIENSPPHQVDLGGMKIIDSELLEIAELITQIRFDIAALFINNNAIGDDGAKIIGKKFLFLKNLSMLDLQFNAIDKEGIAAIYALKEYNPHLRIAFHGNKIINPEDLLRIEKSVKNIKL